MDAVEYLKKRRKLCDAEGRERCDNCILSAAGGCLLMNAEYGVPEKAVRMVEKWNKEHAPKTNREKFEEVFGRKANEPDDPRWWDEPYTEPSHE